MRNAKKDAMLESKYPEFQFKLSTQESLLMTHFLSSGYSACFLGRYTEIERENRILLEKMSNIMQNPKPALYNPMRVEKASLNRVQRKKELMKITVENQAILKRL